MKLREIFRSPSYYSVCETDRTGNLVVYVITGGVMMYEVIVELTKDEITEFHSQGHLDRLAHQIACNPSRFEARLVKQNDPDEKLEFVEGF